MKNILLMIIVSTVSSLALAGTTYIINGKEVSKFEALQLYVADPATKVLKVSANWTRLNRKTTNFVKTEDATKADICK